MKKETVMSVLKEAVITGIITGVVCFIIFIFLNKAPMGVAAIAADLPMTVLPTGLICVIVQAFMKKSAAKKGNLPEMGEVKAQACYALVPENGIVFVIFTALMAVLLFGCAPIGAILVLAPEAELSRWIYIILKVLMAGCSAGYASFHGTIFFTAKYTA